MQAKIDNKEYRKLIRSIKQKDPDFYKRITKYLDGKLEAFLQIIEQTDKEFNMWQDCTVQQKVQALMICIEIDFCLLELTTEQQSEIVPDMLKILEESFRRQFAKEEKEDSEEIEVDPEYQDLLEEALRKIDAD